MRCPVCGGDGETYIGCSCDWCGGIGTIGDPSLYREACETMKSWTAGVGRGVYPFGWTDPREADKSSQEGDR